MDMPESRNIMCSITRVHLSHYNDVTLVFFVVVVSGFFVVVVHVSDKGKSGRIFQKFQSFWE